MEILVRKTPGNLWEYILVANPDTSVGKKVLDIRRDFGKRYAQKNDEDSGPHLKIASFGASESMEETVIRWMQRICSQCKGFHVTLNNYSGFPSHSIYLRVQDHEPFRQLGKRLKVIDEYLTSCGCLPARFVARPHIVIATGLDVKLYDKAMSDYSQRTFHESFSLSGLVLSKRSSEFDNCRQVNVFRFFPPDTNMYGEVA